MTAEGRSLTFDKLRAANVQRCETSFHAIDGWTPTDWACAFAGEAGEACNEVKKLRRLQTAPEWNNPSERDAELIVRNIGAELADTVIYADLLAARLGIDLGGAIRQKFNDVSFRVKSEVLL